MHKCQTIHSIFILVQKNKYYALLVKVEEIAQILGDTSYKLFEIVNKMNSRICAIPSRK